MAKEKQYRYSEIFGRTIQGEGQYTGVPTSWVRFYGCNLECNGFGQLEPTKPETYELPYQKIDLTDISHVEQLPVFPYGCDSSYSWSERYRHLAHLETAEQICQKIEDVTKSEFNPEGKFLHPKTGQSIHMAFTGGEPIMSQHALVDIMRTFDSRNNTPKFITIETNGTRPLKKDFIEYFKKEWKGSEVFWSVSPKLFNTSGEKDAICPEIVLSYQNLETRWEGIGWGVGDVTGQLKFVVNGTDESWAEVESAIKQFRDAGVTWPVWIMPVGATKDEQESIQAKVAEQCFDRGYNFSARLHNWIFGNIIGK